MGELGNENLQLLAGDALDRHLEIFSVTDEGRHARYAPIAVDHMRQEGWNIGIPERKGFQVLILRMPRSANRVPQPAQPGASGIWRKHPALAFARDWTLSQIGAAEGVLISAWAGCVLGIAALLVSFVLGNAVPEIIRLAVLSAVGIVMMYINYYDIVSHHQYWRVIQPDGTIANSPAVSAARTAMSSFISVPFIAAGLALGGLWLGLIPVGIAAGAGLHAYLNHRRQMDWLRSAA